MLKARQDMEVQDQLPDTQASSSSSAIAVEQKSSISTIVAESLACEADWSITLTQSWIIASYQKTILPEQGWKLHVSAGLCSAEEVLCRVMPVLRAEHVCFKVAVTLKKLRSLNHGFVGASQVGKFITVYCLDEQQAVRLGLALDEVTRGLRGPAVSSDHSLHADSLVSYRYGSYSSKLMYTAAGKVVLALTTPSGELIPDSRHYNNGTFDWVQDPFIAAGVSKQPVKSKNTLIGKRYLPLFTLYNSARGGTLLGVDILGGYSCVLKFAWQNAYLAMDGKDARDTLRYEAAMLERLAGDPAFPALFDLLEQDATLYMVMEEVQGETLGKCAERCFAQGDLPVSNVISWGRTLAGILANIHARGLVYHDLKPTNVMVSSERQLRLIDFELMVEQGIKHMKSDIGTRGFMSPQHQAGEAASTADDIYSLGALLYYLVTRANPSLAPDPTNLLQRPLKVLNPTLDQGLVDIISRCLERDPERRFASMGALGAALAALEIPGSIVVCEQVTHVTPEHYLNLAHRLGDTLCQNAHHQPQQPGAFWLSTVQFADGRPLRALNCGSAGTLLALAELVDALQIELHRSILRAGAQWLLQSETLIANPMPGLYVGEAGIGAALLRAGQVLNDVTLIEAAVKKGQWVAKQPYTCQDVMSGAAGRLRFHLLLWDQTHNPEHMQAALEAGNWLVSVAEDAGDGFPCWTLPSEFTGMTYVGYAHGAAGIADTLLDLFEASGDEHFLTPVRGVCRLLEHLAVPVLHDLSGLNWPLYVFDEKREMAGVYWCHGATGIGTFLLHASQLNLMPIDFAIRAARTAAYGSRWTGPTLCHGLAGNIEFLLDMFAWTGEQVYCSEALTLASLLETFAVEHEGQLAWPSDEPSCISPDYLIGYAGILTSLLRLANPEHRPHLLSRRGFRYKPASIQAS